MPEYFHVAPLSDLVQLQVAIDQEVGLRDAAGNPTPRQQMVHKPGQGLVPAFQAGAFNCVDLPGTHYPIIEGDDGTAAMQLNEVPVITDNLGKTLKAGKALPRLNQLVRAVSEGEYDKLPPGVMRVLDSRYFARFFVGQDADPNDPNNLLKIRRKLTVALADIDTPANLPAEVRATLLEVVAKLKPARAKACWQKLKDVITAENTAKDLQLQQDVLAKAAGISAPVSKT
jgi:hypothetical protein